MVKQSNENVREGQFPNDSIDDDDILYIRFTIGLAEETIIFVPIGIIIARTLGYDALTGAAMVILGAASGFSGGMLNPFTVGVAQTVAELPMFSGWGLRSSNIRLRRLNRCCNGYFRCCQWFQWRYVKSFTVGWHKPLLNYQCSQAGVYVQLSIYLS